jgi:3-(3-hydroxy-phenyl)propionate hydroxylase
MARYLDGIVVHAPENVKRKDNPVGRLFMQPSVQVGQQTKKLDDAIGPKFCVIGISQDPCDIITPDNLAMLSRMDFATLYVRPSKSIDKPKSAASTSLEAEDVHGKFRAWLLKHPQWQFVVVRPDRYVAAVCSAPQLNSTLETLARLMK